MAAEQRRSYSRPSTPAAADPRDGAHLEHRSAEPVAGPLPIQVRERLLAVHADTADFYATRRGAAWVPSYLESRGLGGVLAPESPWQVGYAPRSWTALTDHLRQAGYSDSTLEASGLSMRARTGHLIDRFRDRLMLPIRDHDARVVAFVGRARPDADDRTPKYLNSPTTAIYRKGEHLFGLAEARTAIRAGATATLTEGPLDAVAVHLATGGGNAAVALCGTAFSPEHADALGAAAPADSRAVVVATDPDPAGHAAAQSAYHRLRAVGLLPWSADLPPGMDPAELLRAHGCDGLAAAVTTHTRPLVDVLVERSIAAVSERLRWVEGRVGAVRSVAPLLVDLDPRHRHRLSRHVADLTGVAPSTVTNEVAAARRRTTTTTTAFGGRHPPSPSSRVLSTGPPTTRPVHTSPARR